MASDQQRCDLCGGRGTIPDGPAWRDLPPLTCPRCNGTGVEPAEQVRADGERFTIWLCRECGWHVLNENSAGEGQPCEAHFSDPEIGEHGPTERVELVEVVAADEDTALREAVRRVRDTFLQWADFSSAHRGIYLTCANELTAILDAHSAPEGEERTIRVELTRREARALRYAPASEPTEYPSADLRSAVTKLAKAEAALESQGGEDG